MGTFSSKKKTTSTTTSTSAPNAQYAPYVNDAMSQAQSIFNANKPLQQDIGQKAMDVYNGYAGATKNAASLAGGNDPSQSTYNNLANTWANDPSKGILELLSQGSKSPGQYDGIGDSNPALGILSGMTGSGNNPLSEQFYKDTLNGKFLNNNPYLDAIVNQGTDAATKAVNQRFASSGIGEGMSTPYADVLSKNIADTSNNLRYGAYNDELGRMGQIAGQSDNEYDTTQGRNLSAAQSLGSLSNSTDALRLNAQQAKDAAFQGDRSSQLAAAQSLGSQYNTGNATSLSAANDKVQSIINALQLQGALGQGQLGALNASAALPYANVGGYADLINSLTGKYATTNGSGTETVKGSPSLLSSIGQMVNIGSSAASLFSDRRLKTDITKIGATNDGLPIYTYRYLWGGPIQMGVMADEVEMVKPEALGPVVGGYATVNYGAL